MKIIKVELITLDGYMVFNDVYSLSASNIQSSRFVILPDHMPFLISLETGWVALNTADRTTYKIFLINPLLEIIQNKCSIIADAMYTIEDVNLGSFGKHGEKLIEVAKGVDNATLMKLIKRDLEAVDISKKN